MMFLTVLFVSVGLATAQVRVTGTVVSAEDGEPVVGAAVVVKGTTTGTVTDFDGNFSFQNLPSSAKVLVVSYIGLQTQEVAVKPTLKIVMKSDAKMLDEVVISVPYGTTKKSTFTGSAGVVDKKLIASSQVSSVSKALQGTVAGLQSFSTSGQPGEDASIYIRGVGSANASSTPLYVVDGVPYDGALSSISSQDIASMTVLKDAAAATLYGSRAANGVIMITTKQGASAAPTVELSAKFGFSSRAVSDYKQLSTDDYFKLQWEAIRNYYQDRNYSDEVAAQKASANLLSYIGINPYGTAYPQPVGTDGELVAGATALWNDSWEDALTQNAHYTDLSARVSGGNDTSKYYFSLGYLDDQGAYIKSGFERYTMRANITSDIKKWLQVNLNVSGTHSVQDYPKQNDTAIGNVVLAARSIPSFYPVYERDLTTGEYLRDENGDRIYDYGTYRKSSYRGYNFAQSMLYDKHTIKRDAASARGYIQITPLEGLSYKMSMNVDYNSRFNHDYTNPTYGKQPTTGSVSKYNYRTVGMTYNNVINWEHTFKEAHRVHAMIGQEYYSYHTSNFGGSRSNVISDGYYEPDVASVLNGFEGNSDSYKLLSFFGSAEYSYKNRYFGSLSLRTDGSSRFHPDNRWGTFWSFGGSWKITEEAFMENLVDKGLSNLTLRASYGAQGNDNVGYYAYQELYSIGSFLGETTLHTSRLATPDLTWETNLNLNIGLDFGFFNGRLNGTIEYFNRASSDLLFDRDLVPSSGFTSTDANIGKLENYGWEFTVNGTPIMTKDWTWKLSLNATTYKNKITKLPSDVIWQSTKKWVVGGSLYDFWLYEWGGVDPDNGDALWAYYDEDGTRHLTNDYSSLSSDQKVKAGSSLPDVSGGFQSDLTWKGLSLSTAFTYSIGGKIYNNDIVQMMRVNGGDGSTMSATLINRWTPENRYTDVPRLVENGSSKFTSASTRWLTDRSYLRLKTVTLNYNLPKSWIHSTSLREASVFVQGENMLTFSKQQGLDPEQPISGMASFRYPAMKTISFGVNVKL